MALDWNKWREARLGEDGRAGLAKRPLPGPWNRILKSNIGDTTWPYTAEEITVIRSLLPDEHREVAAQEAVRSAQLYVYAQTRKRQSNPRKEIEHLRGALDGIFQALMRLSPEARTYLNANMRPARLSEEGPFTADALRDAIDRFDFENRQGLETLPDQIRGGARPRQHERRLEERLVAAFIIGHGGERPKRGFPAFYDACFIPLKDFGLLPRSSSAMRDANRKRRKNPTKIR
jgi:hypothetical protein